MAYPASTGVLSSKLNAIDNIIATVKLTCQQVRAESLAGSIPSSRILDLFINLKQWRVDIVAAASVPGMAAYAQEQKNAPGLDIVAEFTAVRDGIDAVTDWIAANFPKGTGDHLLAKKFSADGSTIIDRTFDTASLASFRTQLEGLIALIS